VHAIDLIRKALAAAIGHQAEPLKDELLVVQKKLFPLVGELPSCFWLLAMYHRF
jgi:hypothetical protein